MGNEDIALKKAIHGYYRSMAYRRHEKARPDELLCSVTKTDQGDGITQFTITLRGYDGTELQQIVWWLLADGHWQRIKA
jgi:hypothetical protein